MNTLIKRDTTPTTHAQAPRRAMTALGLALALGLVAAATGCPATTDTNADGGGMVTASFSSLYGDYLGRCKQCHSPDGPGRSSDIEKSLDFTTRTTALSTLRGTATGLIGNHTGCNGVPFLAATPDKSLLVAVIDQPTRQTIDLPGHADCDADAITDAAFMLGSPGPSSDFITALKTWISNGAMDN